MDRRREFIPEPPSAGEPELGTRFASIVEFLPDAAFAVDRSGRSLSGTAPARCSPEWPANGSRPGNQAYAEPFFGERRPTLIDLMDTRAAEVEARYESVRWDGDVVQARDVQPPPQSRSRGLSARNGFSRLRRRRRLLRSASNSFGTSPARRAVERALEESRQRLLKAQRLAGVGFVDWDLQTDRVFMSEETRELTGFRPEREVTSSEFLARMVPPEDVGHVRENLDLAIRGVKPLRHCPSFCPARWARVLGSRAGRVVAGRGRCPVARPRHLRRHHQPEACGVGAARERAQVPDVVRDRRRCHPPDAGRMLVDCNARTLAAVRLQPGRNRRHAPVTVFAARAARRAVLRGEGPREISPWRWSTDRSPSSGCTAGQTARRSPPR